MSKRRNTRLKARANTLDRSDRSDTHETATEMEM